jgi:hypothetical protein
MTHLKGDVETARAKTTGGLPIGDSIRAAFDAMSKIAGEVDEQSRKLESQKQEIGQLKRDIDDLKRRGR